MRVYLIYLVTKDIYISCLRQLTLRVGDINLCLPFEVVFDMLLVKCLLNVGDILAKIIIGRDRLRKMVSTLHESVYLQRICQ